MASMSFEFTDDALVALRRVAKEQGVPEQDIIHDAFALYLALHDDGVRPGGKKKIVIHDAETDEALKDITF